MATTQEGQQNPKRLLITKQDIATTLEGVQAATKNTEEGVVTLISLIWNLARCLANNDAKLNLGQPQSQQLYRLDDGADECSLTAPVWKSVLDDSAPSETTASASARLILAIALLRSLSRQADIPTDSELDPIWGLIHAALLVTTHEGSPLSVQRSAQGFVSVPLCSHIVDGDLNELWRLHVWLPDGKRGQPLTAVHSHQSFVQSWILAGEGTDCQWDVNQVSSREAATHAEYHLSWTAEKGSADTIYKTHQTHSIIENTGKLVQATPGVRSTHGRGMTYCVPAARYHTSTVAPDAFHATLVYFNGKESFVKAAGVLGPIDGQSFTVLRAVADVQATDLVAMIESMRTWEKHIDAGRSHAGNAHWEEALREFDRARYICDNSAHFPTKKRSQARTLMGLANTNRRFGRYERAADQLQSAFESTEDKTMRAEICGELSVVKRHLDDLSGASIVLSTQLELAREVGLEQAHCRAIGNLGMVNYRRYLLEHDADFLHLAIEQLEERVRTARLLKSKALAVHDAATRNLDVRQASTWEIVGLNRLSLCYTTLGNVQAALSASLASIKMASLSSDATVQGMCRFFHARTLIHDGQKAEALAQLNKSGRCPPVIALCKEPSQEHCTYLQEAIDAGADLDVVDEHGYSALDYVIFNADAPMKDVVLAGLSRQLVDQRLAQAELRKGYRVLMQEHLRPTLTAVHADGFWARLRESYANGLTEISDGVTRFDDFKVVGYEDFVSAGRIPRSDGGLAQRFTADAPENFVVFFSYRWLGTQAGLPNPDDEEYTQYQRMVAAIESLCELDPTIDVERLGIWVDYACVDQAHPGPGVAALPMNLAQCNVVICLVDEVFHTRAWCALEVDMIQTLRKSYKRHRWYEQVSTSEPPDITKKQWSLREGSPRMDVRPSRQKLSIESDRAAIKFLERQQSLLGSM